MADWVGMMTKDEERKMEDFILYLYDGFVNFSDDRHIKTVFSICLRYCTAKIGERKNLKISKKALKLLNTTADRKKINKAKKDAPGSTVQDHQIPEKMFLEEFRAKKEKGMVFTRKDAKRWLTEAVIAIITKEEDEKITKKGWRDRRPYDAYTQLGIELENVY